MIFNDGYNSKYNFAFLNNGDAGQTLWEYPEGLTHDGSTPDASMIAQFGRPIDPANPDNFDPQYQRDLQQFLGASGGVGFGALGDNVGQGNTLGSLFSNEFFLAALGLGAAAGGAALYNPAAFGLTGAPAAAGTEALASPTPLTTGGSFIGATGEGFTPAAGLAPELEGGSFAAAPASSFTGGSSPLTFANAARAVSTANSLANVARDPSGGNAGSLVGGLAGAATGIPGASTVGSFAGGTVGRQFDSSGGGTAVADPSSTQDIVQILAAAIGLGGAGLSLADQARLRSQLTDIFHLSQEQLTQINQLAQQYQNQNQAAYPERVAQTAQDRANQQRVFDEAQAAYGQRVGEVAQDRDRRGQVFGERQAVGQRLQDPTQLAAGAQSLFNPYAQGVQDETVRAINRSQALRGTGDGGVANLAAAKALVPLNAQLYQQAMQNFLTSQTSALGGFDYPASGPYTPDPGQAPSGNYTPYPERPAQFTNPTGYAVPPGAFSLGQGSGPGDIIGNLVKILGTGNTPGLLKLLGLDGGSFTEPGNPSLSGVQGQDFSKLGAGLDTTTPGGSFDTGGTLSLLPPDSLAFN